MVLQSDPFTVWQSEQLVVIHDRVHVLNPDGVDVAIEDNVMPLVLAVRKGLVHLPEGVAQKAITPIACVCVKLAVELIHVLRFRVQHMQLCWQFKACLSACERFDDHCLATTCRPNNHGRVPRHQRFIQLHYFVNLLLLLTKHLVSALVKISFNCVVELLIPRTGHLQSREYVA